MCAYVFEVVAGGMPVKAPEESSRVSKEATEAEPGDVETGSGASSGSGSEGQMCWSLQDVCSYTAVPVTSEIPGTFPDFSLD